MEDVKDMCRIKKKYEKIFSLLDELKIQEAKEKD